MKSVIELEREENQITAFARPSLESFKMGRLKAIAQERGIVPVGNKTKKAIWVEAIYQHQLGIVMKPEVKLTKTEKTILDAIASGQVTYTSRPKSSKRTQKALDSLVSKDLIKCIKTDVHEYPTRQKYGGCRTEQEITYTFALIVW